MFNFLFEGKIGDILAPVVPSNQLFLAIQHFKNAELNNLLNSTGYNPAALADGGYAAIHVACRYNNRVALEILLSRGTNIQLADQHGDSPLHYAAKYGHLDLCKFLIERGASVHARNRNNQSPYDIAESHLVRQYLLPLQLQAERSMPEFQQAPPYGNLSGVSYAPPGPTAAPSIAPPAYISPPPMQHSVAPQTSYYPASTPPNVNTIPSSATPPILAPTAPALVHSVPPPAVQPVPTNMAPPTSAGNVMPPPAVPNYNYSLSQNARPTNTRMIQPDGFHSSASDPVLQQKYGHIIEKPSIAPPPTGAMPYAPAGPPPQVVGGAGVPGIYSRYVPYDAHSNVAAPIPQATVYNPHVYHPPAPAPSLMTPPLVPPQVVQPPLSPSKQAASVSPPTFPPSTSNASTNRFLGNKAPIGDLFSVGAEPLIATPARPSPTNTNVLSPFNEGDVINASSTSSSVL